MHKVPVFLIIFQKSENLSDYGRFIYLASISFTVSLIFSAIFFASVSLSPALFASTKSEIHRKYLLKMGFAEENGRLKKRLA